MEEFLSYIAKMSPGADLDLIKRAYLKAEEKHQGQKRKSGEDYIMHPIAVGKIVAELGMDDTAIAAALLHDVVEDTDYTIERLKKNFGEEVALLVDGVTKLDSLKYENKEERQAENLRKMFLAMSKDIRVLLIKLADRLHNMRTIDFQPETKISEISQETLEIYSPLANRLGIFKIKFELEDIALRGIDHPAYEYLCGQIQEKMQDRETHIEGVLMKLRASMDALGIKYDISARSKHFYSIYRKMKYQSKNLEEIFDLVGIRIIVESVRDCYAVLGIVHTMWKPIPGRFKDYIAMPKSNMYQSLHTTLLGEKGQPFEIQIRTYEMHKIAEYGIAAHWKYKEGVSAYSDEEKLAWIRQTMEWNKEMQDPKEFMEALKMDLFSNQVFVLSPKGDIVELSAGSTPLDFAFKIHSEVGVKCIGAKVNGKIVPIDYELQNGNIIEIITSNSSRGPSIDWLKIVKSPHTKNKIRQWLKKENRSENAARGKDMLEKHIRRKGYDSLVIMKTSRVNKIAKQLNFASAEDLFSAVGYGGMTVGRTVTALFENYTQETREELLKAEKNAPDTLETARKKTGKKAASGVVVKGVDNLLIRFSKCCTPVPGDPIIGFVTKGRGISVHRTDCVNVLSTPPEEKGRFIEVEWDEDKQSASYDMEITVIAENRKGFMAELSRLLDEIDIGINGLNIKVGKDNVGTINLLLNIHNLEQMDRGMSKIRAMQGVIGVYRSNN